MWVMDWIVRHPAFTMALVVTLTILASPVMGWPLALVAGAGLTGVVVFTTFYQKRREKQINALIAKDKAERKAAKHEYLKKRRSELKMGIDRRPAPGQGPSPPPAGQRVSFGSSPVAGPSVPIAAKSGLPAPAVAEGIAAEAGLPVPVTVKAVAPVPIASKATFVVPDVQPLSKSQSQQVASTLQPVAIAEGQKLSKEQIAAKREEILERQANRNFAWNYKEALHHLLSRDDGRLNDQIKNILHETLKKIDGELSDQPEFISLFSKDCGEVDFKREFSELLDKHPSQITEFNWLREKVQLIERLQKAINPEKQKPEEKIELPQREHEKTPMEKRQQHSIIFHQEKEEINEHPKEVSVKD